MNVDPVVSLGIDNCFAAKRFTRPRAWMALIREMGLTLIEASADTECDPLYQGPDYVRDWRREVNEAARAQGVRVTSLYSGHGTYYTLGLAHTDARVRARFRDAWMKAQIDSARAVGANLGFFAHSFDDEYLQDHGAYMKKLEELYDNLAELARYARDSGLEYISLEQMYSPNMPPWTIAGARELMRQVYARAGAPMHLTVDLGHMNGQANFLKPDRAQIERWIEDKRAGRVVKRVWLGSKRAMGFFYRAARGEMGMAAALDLILEDIERNPHLFAGEGDGSVANWLEALGAHSPIIHLQQSDGQSSPHWPFDPAHNALGIIRAQDALASLIRAYEAPDEPGMPPKARQVVLTLEPFIATAGNNYDLIEEIEQSVAYWRGLVPRDGMRLSEIRRALADS